MVVCLYMSALQLTGDLPLPIPVQGPRRISGIEDRLMDFANQTCQMVCFTKGFISQILLGRSCSKLFFEKGWNF